MNPRERFLTGLLLLVALAGLLLAPVLAPHLNQALPASPSPAKAAGGTPRPLATPSYGAFPVTGDSFIDSRNVDRNYGSGSEVDVGEANGTAYHGLAKFNLTPIPSSARIVNATLKAHVVQGMSGATLDVHRVRAPWTEGAGMPFRYRTNFTVQETSNVSRLREPVDLAFTVPVPFVTNVRTDFRVYDDIGREVPSQVYGATYASGNVTGVHVVFGATVGALQSRAYSLYYGNLVPTVPTFRTKVAPLTPFWSQPGGAKYASLTAADLNGDGKLEVIVGSLDTYVYVYEWNGSLLWKWKAPDVIGYYTTAVDVDGDGQLEVVFATDGSAEHRIFAISADGQREKWNTSSYPTGRINGPIAISDTDGDGEKTVYAGSLDGYLYAFWGTNGTRRWWYPLSGSNDGFGAAVANLTGDGRPEVVFTTISGDFYVMNANLTFRYAASPSGRATQVSPSVGDLDGNGINDVVAGDNFNNGRQFAFRGSDGVTLWNNLTGSSQYAGQLLVDFNDDGRLETAVSMTGQGQLGFMDAGGTLYRTVAMGDRIWGVSAAADINLDGVEDIVVPVGDPLGPTAPSTSVVAANGTTLRQYPVPDAVTSTPIVADLDGDGNMELVFASRTTVYAFNVSGLGHDFRTGGYNYNNTGRFLDGSSPDGARLLTPTLSPYESLGSSGVTWRSRDGTLFWAAPGADYDASVAGTATVSSPGTWLTWNLTSLVQSWTNGSLPNAGILFKMPTGSGMGITVLSSREASANLAAILEITYYENVSPQIAGTVPNQVYPEDTAPWTLDLLAYADDPDTPANFLRWDLAGANTSLFTYTGGNVTGNHALRFTVRPNAYGNDRVTLYLFDPQGHYAAQNLWVNITPIDDAPVFTPPTILYVKYGSPYTFDFTPYVSDVDNPLSALRLTTDDPGHTSVSGFRVTFTYPTGYPDPWAFVVLTVSDGTLSNAQSIAIRLTTDSPPELRTFLPDVSLREGETVLNVFDLDDFFVDPDNDVLFFSYGFTHLEVLIKADHTVDITALGEFYGTESVTFRASDPTGAIIEDTIFVTVTPVNDPPVIAPFPDFVIHYDDPYIFDLSPYVADTDTPMSQVTITTSNPNNVTVLGKILRLLYPEDLGGMPAPYQVPLTIFAFDGLNTTSRTINVTVGNDYPPRLQIGKQVPDESFREDEVLANAFDLDDYFTDPDSSTIFYWSGPVHVHVSINDTNVVSFNASKDWFGTELVTFRASDAQGAYAEDTIQVTVEPVNDAPYFKDLPVVTSETGKFIFDLRDFVGDVDTNLSQLVLGTNDTHVSVQGFILVFDYPSGLTSDDVPLVLADGEATTSAVLQVRITPPNPFLALLPWAALLGALLAAFFIVRLLRTSVEHIFLIYEGGIPLIHLSKTISTDKDPDLIASMFSAIQSFMNESFHSMGVGELKSIELADHRVAVARGQYVFLVVVYRGRASSHVENQADDAVKQIEKRFRDVLKDWNGDVDTLEGIEMFLEHEYGTKASGEGIRPTAVDVPSGKA